MSYRREYAIQRAALAQIEKDVTLRLGLLSYVDGDYETALATWKKLSTMDNYFAAQEKAGWGNVILRLTRAAQETPGAIYMEQRAMKNIRDKRKRLAVYLGDLYYVNEQPLQARNYYQNLLDEKYGKLSREEKAVAIYGVFAANCWDPKVDEIKFAEQHLNDLRGTAVEPKILLGMGNRAASNGEAENFANAIKYYDLLRKYHPQSPEASDALFLKGRIYRYWAQFDEPKKKDAIKILTAYVKKQKSGGYVKAADRYLTTLTNTGGGK